PLAVDQADFDGLKGPLRSKGVDLLLAHHAVVHRRGRRFPEDFAAPIAVIIPTLKKSGAPRRSTVRRASRVTTNCSSRLKPYRWPSAIRTSKGVKGLWNA